MIFEQALRRELSMTTGAVFLVLVTIMITTLVIRILGFAANGVVNPEDALVLIALATLGYFAILLTVSLFIAVLIVLVRWYKDSEMIVWFISGLSITNLIGPILRFSIPLIVIIAVLAAVVWPWANRESSIISQRFQQRDDVSMITAGQFKESAKAERVFFIESIEIDKSEVKNIFVADTRNQKLSVAVAATGYIENSPNGDKNIILLKGRRYEGQPTQANFRILEFGEYETKIRGKEVAAPPPRDREKNAAMFYAVLIYLIYSNLLNLTQNYVSQGRLEFFVGLWPIHLIAFLLAYVLIRNRINPSLKWWQRQLPWAYKTK